MNPNIIALTGASGFIGASLVESLKMQSFEIRSISRKDLQLPIEQLSKKIDGCLAVINLAGAPIIRRWTAKNMHEMVQSRLFTTRKLVEAINSAQHPPQVFISASAVGIYTDNLVQTEDKGELSSGFAGQLCQDWESESKKARPETRVVNPRIGIVLGNSGGALQKMLPAFKLGLGGIIGSGRQYFPWIHLTDLIEAFIFAIHTPSLIGAVNMVAPERITNKQFTQQLAKTLHRPAFIPIPELALKLLYGKGASTLTQGQEVLPEKLLKAGYNFRHPTLQQALNDLLSKE